MGHDASNACSKLWLQETFLRDSFAGTPLIPKASLVEPTAGGLVYRAEHQGSSHFVCWNVVGGRGRAKSIFSGCRAKASGVLF